MFRVLKIAVVFGCMMGFACPNHAADVFWGEDREGFQIGILFEKVDFQKGEPIKATLILRNLTATTGLPIRFNPPEAAYRFSVTRDSAIPVVNTSPRRYSLAGYLTMAPDSFETNEVRLDLNLNFSEVGTYSIAATRFVPPQSKSEPAPLSEHIEARSGTAVINVQESLGHTITTPVLTTPNASGGTGTRLDYLRNNSTAVGGAPSVTVSKSNVEPAPAIAIASSISDGQSFTSVQRTSVGIIAGLLALLLAILWRAARRKRET